MEKNILLNNQNQSASFPQSQIEEILQWLTQLREYNSPPDEFLCMSMDKLYELLECGGICLYYYNSEPHNKIICINQKNINLKIYSNLCEFFSEKYFPCLSQGESIIISEIEPSFPPQIKETLTTAYISSLLIMPLWHQNNYLGFLSLDNPISKYPWHPAELTIIKIVVNQLAIAIYQEKILQENKEQQRLNKILKNLHKICDSYTDFNSLIEKVLILIQSQIAVEKVGFWYQKQAQLIYHIQNGQLVTDKLEIILDSPEIIENKVMQKRHDFNLLNIPVTKSDKWLGCLILQKEKLENYTLAEQKILILIAREIAITLTYHRLQQKQQTLNKDHQAKEEYVSYISHEIRAPLAAIFSFSRMLLKQIYGNLNQKQLEYVRGILSTSKYGLDLSEDLLQLSKIEAGKETISSDKIAIQKVCRAALSLVEEMAEEKKLSLIFELDSKLNYCVGDQRHLQQILVNLLTNAVKFTEQGTVTLEVTSHHKLIHFSVIDTGIGIKILDQKKLFQPFSKLNTELHKKHKSTGLGLALSRKLARLNGGDITFTSQEGVGSCFTLQLPLQ